MWLASWAIRDAAEVETVLTAPGEETREGDAAAGVLLAWAGATFVLASVAVTLPLSVGAVTPSLAIGAALGRLLGLAMQRALPGFAAENGARGLHEVMLAVVGAGAFLAGVTHTLSAAVFMLELTGRFELVLPLLLGATASVAVSRRLRANGIFDAMIYSKARLSYYANTTNTYYLSTTLLLLLLKL